MKTLSALARLWVLLGLALACAQKSAPPSSPAATPPSEPAADAGWRSTPPRPSAPGTFSFPSAQSSQLESGLTLHAIPRDTRLVVAALVVRAGAADDPADKHGLAAVTGRMLTESTLDKSDIELAEAAEALGSELLSSVSRDYSMLSFKFLADDLEPALTLMSEVVQEPSFDPRVFSRVQAEWLDLISSRRQDPTALAAVAGMRAALGAELGAPTLGSVSGVKALSRADLAGYHAHHYRPESAALIVSGGVTLTRLRAVAERTLGSWRGTAAAARRPSVARSSRAGNAPAAAALAASSESRFQSAVIVDRPGSVQSALFVAQAFPARNEPGYEARQLLNQVLGGMFSSRLNHNLREQHGFTYGARSRYAAHRQFGVWALSTSVQTRATLPALKQVLLEISELQGGRPLDEQELTRARQELLSGYAQHLERSADLVQDFADLFGTHVTPDYLSGLAGELGRQSLGQVQAEAARLRPERLVVVIVGDRQSFRGGLEAVSAEVLDATPELLD